LLSSTRLAAAEPARIEYSAPASCPTETAFAARVRERGGNVDAPSAAGSVIAVAIREAEGEFAGSVRLETDGSSSAARDVRSPYCEEVADGLAVVVAITLQGKAREPGVATPPPSAAGAAARAPTPVATVPIPTPKPEPRELATLGQWRDETVEVGPGEVGVRADVVATLGAGATLGLLPGTVTPRFDLSLARTNFITTPAGDGYIVGGIFRVRWTLLGPMTYEADGFRSEFLALKAGIGGCSQLVYDRKGLVLIGCGEIAAGVGDVVTKSESGAKTQDETQGFGTAGFDFEARYNISRHFHAGVMLGAEVWVAGLTAQRPDGSELVSTNVLTGYATVGFGLHF
jgi:hypothetical protein